MFTAILSTRRSCDTAISSSSSDDSDRSRRCVSPTLFPPSISCGSPTRPNVELARPVYEMNGADQTLAVSGEIEVDISMFRDGDHILPYSIGIHFEDVSLSPAMPSEDDAEEFRGEWQQDGPGNYYRRRSFIHMQPRVTVDDVCYVKFIIDIPFGLLPHLKESKIFSVAVKAYELGDPFNVTEPSAARFMVLNRIGQTPTPSHRASKFSSFKLNTRLRKRNVRYTVLL